MTRNYIINGREYSIGQSINDNSLYEATPSIFPKTEHERTADIGEIGRRLMMEMEITKVKILLSGEKEPTVMEMKKITSP